MNTLLLDLSPRFKTYLEARAAAGPTSPRLPLYVQGGCVGSVAPMLLDAIRAGGATLDGLGLVLEASGPNALLRLPDDPAPALERLGQILHDMGMTLGMPDERLALCDEQGIDRGSVPRQLVRLLGIPTHSVHLVGLADAGGCWVQQRALTKAEDPGLLDTLVGGTVARGETIENTLVRELWEEAGLLSSQLAWLRALGRITVKQPRTVQGQSGYQIEHIHCFAAALLPSVVPKNQDGEVRAFKCLPPQQLSTWLQAGAFTLEAACVMLQIDTALAGLSPEDEWRP